MYTLVEIFIPRLKYLYLGGYSHRLGIEKKNDVICGTPYKFHVN